MRVRHSSEEDVLLVLDAQVGLVARGEGEHALGEVPESLRKATAGGRVHPPQGGLPGSDLDYDPSPERRAEPWYQDLLELRKLVRVEKSRVLLDEEGRLCFVGLTRVHEFLRFPGVVNTMINRELQQHESDKPAVSGFPAFDEATAAAMRAAIERNHPWLCIQDGAFVLDLPKTQANAARCLAWLTRESARKNDPSWPVILAALSSVEIAGDHARLRFGEAPKRTVEFDWMDGDVSGEDPALQAALARHGIELGDARTGDEVLALFDAKPESGASPQPEQGSPPAVESVHCAPSGDAGSDPVNEPSPFGRAWTGR